MNARNISYIIIATTGIFAVVIFIIFLTKTTALDTNNPIDSNIFANYGNLVGPITASLLSLASVLLIIQSINDQDKDRTLQNIELKFFELLKIVRENSENVTSKGKSGRSVFVTIVKEFDQLFIAVSKSYPLEVSGKNKTEWKIDLINITYLIIFFGVDASQVKFLKDQIRKIITNDACWHNILNDILNPIINKHKDIKEENIRKPRKSRKFLEYNGYQNILGHYFRHLFQTVKYINAQSSLTYRKKYHYIKILRAQLSTYEQVLFFYNSLSVFGLPWEKGKKIDKENDKLITKYNLTKNITFEVSNNIISVPEFYPNVTYEGQEITEFRKQLEEKYS